MSSSAGTPSQLSAAAARVEGVDELLLSVLRPLRLVERLRLATVCKRWQRMCARELCVPSRHLWRTQTLLRRAAGLRRLEVTGHEESSGDHQFAFLCDAIRGTVGAQLRELVMWDYEGVRNDKEAKLARLSLFEAEQLRASCPNLDGGCRLLFMSETAQDAVALLDLLPGRHAVRLALHDPPVSSDSNRAALSALARSPRLAALHVSWHTLEEAPVGTDSWYSHALGALAVALVSGDSSVELIDLEGPPLKGQLQLPVFTSAADVEACFAQGSPLPGCPLRSLAVDDCGLQGEFLRQVLPIARNSLRHLSSGRGVSLAADGPTLVALLRHAAPSLEHLCLGNSGCISGEDPYGTAGGAAAAASLAPLLRAQSCRLRSLSVLFLCWVGLADPADPSDARRVPPSLTPFEDFADALSRNASLRRLRLECTLMTARETAVLTAALAARAAPLDFLRLVSTSLNIEPSGAGGVGAPIRRGAEPESTTSFAFSSREGRISCCADLRHTSQPPSVTLCSASLPR